MRRLFSALAMTGFLLTGLPAISLGQGMPGFTIFGGPERQNQLSFRLDYGTVGMWDRYRLRIPAKKLPLAIAQLAISYPNYYKGEFDPKNIEVRVKGKAVPLQEVLWNKENNLIEIYPIEPIPAGNNVEIVLSNVKNPTNGGMYNFNARIRTPGDAPLLRYIGTWILSIQ
ncbi:DUF2808 domain-containing protein [Kamptonema animale CS-326]|jgi:hypothetical protein|uniref:DUF2808 domain-containing protein n=1 Tax=Kamptonema TaxID=1501433 RepID=UPI0001DAD10E|nr:MULTISPECIES: DUF2808 domain-containing protein [Kamptonema]MDB9512379.1 DUF2808 domain-containing protein [Kamptonema animale CS-326]CBN58804.1 conserved exported hypothetical protein [Kamptonema sp. PCC 6506]